MPAEREEVVGHADAILLEHFAPDRDHLLLDLGARRHEGVRRRTARRVGSGERALVELAVGRQRQRIKQHHHLRHHVLRQRDLHPLAQRLARRAIAMAHRISGRLGHRVRHQLGLGVAVRAHHHHRLRHAGMRAQHLLDLAQLDAIAAHLDLVIGATEELDRTTRDAPHPIARAISAPIVVHRELLRGQVLAAEIAERHAGSRDPEFARYPHRHFAAFAVHHYRARVHERSADRHRLHAVRLRVSERRRRGLVREHADGRLGGAVVIEHAALPRSEQHARHRQTQRLTAEHQPLPGQHLGEFAPCPARGERAKVVGRHLQHVELVHAHVLAEARRIGGHILAEHVQRGAVQQRGKEAGVAQVGRERAGKPELSGAPVGRFIGGDVEHPRHRACVVDHVGVRHGHRFRHAGGSAREEHVRQ